MAETPLPRKRDVVCTECGASLFQLHLSAEPVSQEVRRDTGAALEQALLAHWQRCGGATFADVDVHSAPFTWWPLDPFGSICPPAPNSEETVT